MMARLGILRGQKHLGLAIVVIIASFSATFFLLSNGKVSGHNI